MCRRFSERFEYIGHNDEDQCTICGQVASCCTCIEDAAKDTAEAYQRGGTHFFSVYGWSWRDQAALECELEKLGFALATHDGKSAVVTRAEPDGFPNYIEASCFVAEERERQHMSEMQKFALHNRLGFSPESFAKRGMA